MGGEYLSLSKYWLVCYAHSVSCGSYVSMYCIWMYVVTVGLSLSMKTLSPDIAYSITSEIRTPHYSGDFHQTANSTPQK